MKSYRLSLLLSHFWITFIHYYDLQIVLHFLRQLWNIVHFANAVLQGSEIGSLMQVDHLQT